MIPSTESLLAVGVPGKPRQWGNAVYVDLAVGSTYSYLGKIVRLVAMEANYCTVEVDGERRRLMVARRALPEVVAGLRIFAADNRIVAGLTSDKKRPDLHGATTRDALLCLSDQAGPLLDPERYAFPIDRSDGFRWSMEEDSHMFAYLDEWRSHEGVDFDLHDARGGKIHALVAIEDGTVGWIDRENTNKQEACLLLESAAQPGIYYLYQHLNEDRVCVSAGQEVRRGQKLGTIWGDNAWGHLHFAVTGYGDPPRDYTAAYGYEFNTFPALCELWHGDLRPRRKKWSEGRFTFDRNRAQNGNRKRLSQYDEIVGYGWRLGTWNPGGKVERSSSRDVGENARLRKTLFAGKAAQATNPADHYEFEVAVPEGRYAVRARIGDREHPTWQSVRFEGVDAGSYDLGAGAFRWTPETVVEVIDGRLTVRLEFRGDTPAGLSELRFQRGNGAFAKGPTGTREGEYSGRRA